MQMRGYVITYAGKLAVKVAHALLGIISIFLFISIYEFFIVKFCPSDRWSTISNYTSIVLAAAYIPIFNLKTPKDSSREDVDPKKAKSPLTISIFFCFFLIFSLKNGFGGLYTQIFGESTLITLNVIDWDDGTSRTCSGPVVQSYADSGQRVTGTPICIPEKEKNKFPSGTEIKAMATASPFGIIVREYEKI